MASGILPPSDDSIDPITRYAYDILGRVIQTTDAEGGVEDQSYDAFGNVTRTWQTLTEYSLTSTTLDHAVRQLTLTRYDQVGRQIDQFAVDDITGGVAEGTHFGAQYNAFGEQTLRQVRHQRESDDLALLNDIGSEYYSYDAAGRLIQSNQNGANIAYRYDLQGNATQTALLGLNGVRIATDTVYDTLGRAIQRRLPASTNVASSSLTPNDGAAVAISFVGGGVTVGAFSSEGFPSNIPGEPGYTVVNNVPLSWPALASGGSYQVLITYRTQGGNEVTYTTTLSGNQLSGGTIEWDQDYGTANLGSRALIASITRIRVEQTSGLDQVIVRASGVSGPTLGLDLTGFANGSVVGNSLSYRLTTASAYSTATVTPAGLNANLVGLPSNLADGSYVYYFDTEENTADLPASTQTRWAGTFTVSGGVVTSFGAAPTDAGGGGDENAAPRPILNQTLDRWGNVLASVDPRNAEWITYYRYNDLNQVEQITQPTVNIGLEDTTVVPGTPESFTYYDSLGRAIGGRDANGHLSTRIYDTAGQVIEERRADGSRWTYAYDALGREVQEGDGIGLSTTRSYDRLDRLTRVQQNGYTTDPQQFSFYAYDQAGNRILSENGLGEITTSVYDSRGRLIEVRQPLWGRVDSTHLNLRTQYSYDDLGRQTIEARGSQSTHTSYDYFGRRLSSTDLAGSQTTYSYDVYGRLIRQTSTRVNQQLATAGAATSVSTGGEDLEYQYNADGSVAQIIDHNPAGDGHDRITRYAYDLAGNRTQELVEDSVTGARYQDAHLFYDALGRLSAETDRGASISYSYDAVGNRRRVLTQTQGSTPGTVASNDRWYRYDALNRLTLANGGRVNGQIVGDIIGYDGNGNRAYVQSGSLYTLYRYTPDHQISQIYRSGSTSTSTGTLTQQRRYDAAGRVVEIDDNSYTGSTLTRIDRQRLYYNADGQLITQLNDHATNGAAFQADSRIRYSDSSASATVDDNNRGAVGSDLGFYDPNLGGQPSRYTVEANNDSDSAYDYTSTYRSDYVAFGGSYRQARQQATSTLQGFTAGTTTTAYDTHGNTLSINNPTGNPTQQDFVNDASGRILHKTVTRSG
ncbi:MAG: hypothetical protein M0P19_13030, partial [Nevskia sp.]|nr:hypothetical protein [Nevskia sp.]